MRKKVAYELKRKKTKKKKKKIRVGNRKRGKKKLNFKKP